MFNLPVSPYNRLSCACGHSSLANSALRATLARAAICLAPANGLPPSVDYGSRADSLRAREILKKAAISEAEQEVRLQVLKATLTGTVIRPDDDYPEMQPQTLDVVQR